MDVDDLPPYELVLQMAEEKKDPQAYMLLGRYYVSGEEVAQGLHYFEEAAMAGSIEGATSAASIYRTGYEDVDRCGKKAREYLRIAAELGDLESYWALGESYWAAFTEDANDTVQEINLSTETEEDEDLDLSLYELDDDLGWIVGDDGGTQSCPKLSVSNTTTTKLSLLERYQRLAVKAWLAGANAGNPKCARRAAEWFHANQQTAVAVKLWERAASQGENESVKSLARVHASTLADSNAVRPVKHKTNKPASVSNRTESQFRPKPLVMKKAKVLRLATVGNKPSTFKPLVPSVSKEPTTTSSLVANVVKKHESYCFSSENIVNTAKKFAQYAQIASEDGDTASALSLAAFHTSGLAVIGAIGDDFGNETIARNETNDENESTTNVLSREISEDCVNLNANAQITTVIIDRDPPKALEMYLDAYRNSGAPVSQSLVPAASILMAGDEGVPRNVEKAMELYLEAARQEASGQNPSSAMLSIVAIADAYRSGDASNTGQPNLARAFELYREAADNGDATGYVRLGDCFRDGIGCEKGCAQAFQMYEKAAELSNVEGVKRLAQCLWLGEGCQEDKMRACSLMKSIEEPIDLFQT